MIMDKNIRRMAAFPAAKGGGNPAGVLVADSLPARAEMQRLAAKIGYSESAFLAPLEEDSHTDWVIKYFAPEREINFCGHATIASSVVLGEMYGAGHYGLRTNVGRVDVDVGQDDDGAWQATLTSPPTSTSRMSEKDVQKVLTFFGWTMPDLNPAFPVLVASAGVNHLVLVLRDRQKFRAMGYDFDALKAFMLDHDLTTLMIVWPESEGFFHARNPFPVGGVVEDPATGAAAAAFGGYLRAIGKTIRRFRILQGEDMGRPSLLHVAGPTEDYDGSKVTGTAVEIG